MSYSHQFLKGQNVYLRSLEKEDLYGPYFTCLNDFEVTKFNSHGRFPYNIYKHELFFQEQLKVSNLIQLGIFLIEDNAHVGNISLQNINWIDRNAEFAILIGDKKVWGKGIGEESGKILIKHGFENLNLHRIYCGTSSENLGMQKLALKLGMVNEGVRKESIYKNGKYHDMVEFGILRSKY